MPRAVSFSGHEFAGSLLFEPEEGGARPRVKWGEMIYIYMFIYIYIYICSRESSCRALSRSLATSSLALCYSNLKRAAQGQG